MTFTTGRKKITIGLAVIVLLASLALLQSTGRVSDDPMQVRVQRRSLEIRLNSIGTLDAEQSNMVASELRGDSGKIIYLAQDGDWVKKGDVLVRFDSTPFEATLLALKGDMEIEKTAIQIAELLVKTEKSQLERRIKAAGFEAASAGIELNKLEKGEGPLQLSQLQEEVEAARDEVTRHENFHNELQALKAKGYGNDRELLQAEKKLAQYRKKLLIAENKYKSYSNYVLPAEMEKCRAKVSRTNMELELARKEGTFQIGKVAADLMKAQQKLKNSQERLALATAELDKTEIKAPASGICILYEGFFNNEKRKPRIGDTVWQNRPILYLPDISSLVVKTRASEIDLHKISKNQPAEIRIDAYPASVFRGRISSIGALAEQSTGAGSERSFHMVVAMEGGDERLRPGMTASVSVLSRQLKDVLSLPIAAIHREKESVFCYRRSGGGYVRTPIEIGVVTYHFAEVKSGLKEGDYVRLSPP